MTPFTDAARYTARRDALDWAARVAVPLPPVSPRDDGLLQGLQAALVISAGFWAPTLAALAAWWLA